MNRKQYGRTKWVLSSLIWPLFILPAFGQGSTEFVARESGTALTLGSGVDFVRKDTRLPCFTFDRERDEATASADYRWNISVHASAEELSRARTRSGALSVNAKAVKAAIDTWASQASTQQKSSLYALIEARYEGPSARVKNIQPVPALAALLATGSPAAVLQRCGTHVTTTEHTWQSYRMVVNLSSIDEWSQQELKTRFGASARYGFARATASGSYQSSVTRLAKSKELAVEVEGSGAELSQTEALKLFELKGGDFKEVAAALGELLKTAKAASPTSYVPYGYSASPIAVVANRPDLSPSATDVNLQELQEFEAILSAQLRDTDRALRVNGLSAKEVNRLQAIRKMSVSDLAKLRTDIQRCWVGGRPAAGATACSDLGLGWHQQLSKARALSAQFDVAAPGSDKGLLLRARSEFPANVSILANVNGTDYLLDVFRLVGSPLSLKVMTLSPSAPASARTETPLLAGLVMTLGLVVKDNDPKTSSANHLIVGCGAAQIWRQLPAGPASLPSIGMVGGAPGIYGYGPGGEPPIATLSGVFQVEGVQANSPCAGGAPGLPLPSGPGVAPIDGVTLPYPRQAVKLYLSISDIYGFESRVLVTDDLGASTSPMLNASFGPATPR